MSGLYQNVAYMVIKSRKTILDMLRIRGFDVSMYENSPIEELQQMVWNEVCDFEVEKKKSDFKPDGDIPESWFPYLSKVSQDIPSDQIMTQINSLFNQTLTIDQFQLVMKKFKSEELTGVEKSKSDSDKKSFTDWINSSQKAYVHYIIGNKSNTHQLNSYIKDLDANFEENGIDRSKVEVIVIVKDKPTSSLINLNHELSKKYHVFLQIFWIGSLFFNILEHIYVPNHIIIGDDETSWIKKKYRLESKFQLPIISKDDPVAKFIGMRSGQICRIERTSETAGVYHSYRCCK